MQVPSTGILPHYLARFLSLVAEVTEPILSQPLYHTSSTPSFQRLPEDATQPPGDIFGLAAVEKPLTLLSIPTASSRQGYHHYIYHVFAHLRSLLNAHDSFPYIPSPASGSNKLRYGSQRVDQAANHTNSSKQLFFGAFVQALLRSVFFTAS